MDAAQRARRDGLLARIGSRVLLMGILNVTPDSFSDGGRFNSPGAALIRARDLVADGADIIDVGAESTRPGATPVGVDDELARLMPVLDVIGATIDVPISVDTYKATVAEAAIRRGAVMVNDPWGLQRDPDMAAAVASTQAAVVITHNRAAQDKALDIIDDIRRFFDRSLDLAADAGINRERILLDPGIGFAKTSRQNLAALAGLRHLENYRLPILVGVSRKRFLGSLGDGFEETPVGTVTAAIAAVANGAAVLRVHEVSTHAAALQVFQQLRAT
jgi:dihydropteroate synthase